MKKVLVFLSLVLSLFLVVSCKESVEGITITSKDNIRTIAVGETLQLTAVVYPEKADQAVLWSSSDDKIATVSDSGLVTGVAKGNVEIIATSKKDDNVKQKFALIIEEKETLEVEPESITITAENNVTTCKAGEQIRLTATVLPKEANQAVVWSVDNEEVASVNRGIVTALKEGTVNVKACAKNNDQVYATITLTFEPSDGPVTTVDWENTEYATHEEYVSAEGETPLKVKGVVTFVSAVSNDNTVNYLIQNGTYGFYVYKQSIIDFPIEVGKVYEVGGFKKYYQGLNEIVNVEYFVELNEEITYTVNSLEGLNPTDLEAMEPFHASFVSGKGVLKEAKVNDSKAYNFTATVNGFDTTLRVDPANMTAEEFANINQKLKTAVAGSEFDFVGYMSAYGYGTPKTQIQVVKADDLVFAELSDKEFLDAAAATLNITKSIAFNINDIELPQKLEGFDEIAIVWSSSSESINVDNGAVTHGSENETVTLTAKLTYKEEECEVSFEVLIFAVDTTEYEVVASLDLEDASLENKYGNSVTKPSYAAAVVNLGTPKANWLLQNALISSTDSDIREGIYSIRAQSGQDAASTARIEIQEDGEYNVVEFAVATYGNDAHGAQIKIEYSTDSGTTWTASAEIITVESSTLQTYRIKLPEGVKRVAIVLVENTGRRVNLDNIKLMK